MPEHLISKIFTSRFYRQQLGFFVVVLVLTVGVVPGSQLLMYHHKMIMGMLTGDSFFLLVLGLWLFYCIKCMQFVSDLIKDKQYAFLDQLNQLPQRRLFIFFLRIQFSLYLPVLGYSFIILYLGFVHGYLLRNAIIILFNTALLLLPAYFYRYWMDGVKEIDFFRARVSLPAIRNKPYFIFILSFLFKQLRFLFLTVKLFSCFLLFILLNSFKPETDDLRILMVVYSASLFGHSLVIFKLRSFEETQLSFYRQLPVSLLGRWVQYFIFYVILILPEILIIFQLMPPMTTGYTGPALMLISLSVLLFLHSILVSSLPPIQDYLQMAAGVFILMYCFILARAYLPISILLLLLSVVVFIYGYYRFEKKEEDHES